MKTDTSVNDHRANTGASYLTWVDSLHPEAHVPNVTLVEEDSPLWSVYEGARNDLPIATAVPANLDDQSNGATGNNTLAGVALGASGGQTSTRPNSEDIEIPSSNEPLNDANHNSPSSTGLDLVMSCILSFVAISHVFLIELVGYAVYMISVGFFLMSQTLDPPNIFTGLFYSIFFLIYWILALVDSILLLVSVFVAEVMAAISFGASSLLGGCTIALRWHQYIRKTCHRIRWAFRCRLAYMDPPRHFGGALGQKIEQEVVDFEEAGTGTVDGSDRNKYFPKQGSVSTSATAIPSTPFDDGEDAVVTLG